MSKPTIRDARDFDAKKDAVQIQKAMKGLGTDEDEIIRILTQRSNRQRQNIAACYKDSYNKDLVKTLQSELNGKLEKVILALMVPPDMYDAQLLHDAMKGIGTNENTLIEVLVSRNPDQVRRIVEAYRNMYGKDLVNDIRGDTSGSFEHLLVALCRINRKPDYMSLSNGQQVKTDAQALANAGIRNLFGTNMDVFCEILANRSHHHVRQVMEEYRNITKRNIEDDIRSEMSGNNEEAYIALIECIRYPASYFAKKIHNAMKGCGTKDNDLIRLIVSRSEVDLGDINQEFQRMYGKSLETFVKDECSGDYENALISIIRGNA